MAQAGIIISNAIQAYTFVVILWCLLSWFPNIRWYEQPFRTLDMLVTPVMAPFRKIIPPMGGIDISPMLAILILQMIQQAALHMATGASGFGF